MFTGIVEARSRVVRADVGPQGLRLELDLGSLPGVADGTAALVVGESVAVSGCCLTLAAVSGVVGAFDVVPETLSKTTLGAIRAGERRNVERALRLSDRLGGHLVTGHVDGVGVVREIETRGIERAVDFDVPEPLRGLLVGRGSVAVDGVSLTVADRTPGGFRVALIPHTLEVTTLGGLEPGHRVNLEMDVLAKWVAELLARGRIERPLALDELAAAVGGVGRGGGDTASGDRPGRAG